MATCSACSAEFSTDEEVTTHTAEAHPASGAMEAPAEAADEATEAAPEAEAPVEEVAAE